MSFRTWSVWAVFLVTNPTPMILPGKVRAFGGATLRGGTRQHCGIQFFIWWHFLIRIASGDKRGQLQGASRR